MAYQNGDVVSVKAYVLFYPAQWQATSTPVAERFTFDCTGKMIRRGPDDLKFQVHGASTEQAIPSLSRGRPSKVPILEPLRLSLEAQLGVDVLPFKANVVEGP